MNIKQATTAKVIDLIGDDVIVPMKRFKDIRNKTVVKEILEHLGYRFHHDSYTLEACYIRQGVIVPRGYAIEKRIK